MTRLTDWASLVCVRTDVDRGWVHCTEGRRQRPGLKQLGKVGSEDKCRCWAEGRGEAKAKSERRACIN